MSATLAKIKPQDYDRPAPDGAHGLQRLAEPLMGQLAAALPRVLAGSAQRLVRCLLTCCQGTPALLDCTPRSLLGGLIQAAQLGLEIGGPAGQAYLLPFGDKKAGVKNATLCIGYKGFLILAHRAGVKRFTPRAVHANDLITVEYGSQQKLVHVPDLDDPGEVLAYYAVVETPAGGSDFEYLTAAQARAHRDRYALSKNGPWATAFDEMAKKTCIRKLAKRVPLSVEWTAAGSLDEMADEGIDQQLGANVLTEAPPDKLDELKERAAAAKAPREDDGVNEPPPRGELFDGTGGLPH